LIAGDAAGGRRAGAFLDIHSSTKHLEAAGSLRKDGSIRWILKNKNGKWRK
jgi:hypothetical protein